MADYTITGSNRQLIPGTFTEEDTVTFVGTKGKDTLIGGGGEWLTTFKGTAGNDLYGIGELFSLAYVDYGSARRAVCVDLTRAGGTRTFTDQDGEQRTVEILGRATDGLGSVDIFTLNPSWELFGLGKISSIFGVYGSRFNDWMVGGNFSELHGGHGNDTIWAGTAFGGAGKDRLYAVSSGDFSTYLSGGDGDDCLYGTNDIDFRLAGGAGNDRIFARGGNDLDLRGEAGNDFIDGGAGDDFIDGGVGKDVLVSGAGNDIINPDVEFFQANSGQARDGARDIIRVTRADRGDYTDVVLSRAFEEDRDQIRFADAVKGGFDFRVYHEDQSYNPETGQLWRPSDRGDMANTILQVDQNRDGFGSEVPDASDYFLVVLDADLSLKNGYLLT